MKNNSLHRNVARFSLALMSAGWLSGGSAVIAIEGAGIEDRAVIVQNDASAEAERLFQEGKRLYQEGSAESLRQAIQVWKQAKELFAELGNSGREALVLNELGIAYYTLRENSQALEYYTLALSLHRSAGNSGGEATTLHNIGAVYSALGDKRKALDYYQQVLPLYRAVGNSGGEASILNNIGAVYGVLGKPQEALDYYAQSLPLLRALGDRRKEALTLNNIGLVYSILGEKQKALDYYQQALSIQREIGDRRGEATLLNNIGVLYDDLGEQQKALEYYQQSLPLLEVFGNPSRTASTLNNIALVYFDLGEKQKALEYFDRALPLYLAAGDRYNEATLLSNMGWVYNILGEQQKALDYYQQALPLRRAVGDRAGEAVTLSNTGLVYFELGEKQKALDYYQRALPLHRAVGNKQSEAHTLYSLATFHREENQLPQALESINSAIALIEDLRTKIDSNDLRTSYFATVQDFYQFQTDLLMQMGNSQAAFNTNERSRARTLLDLLATANLDLREGAEPQLLEEERRLRQELQAIEARRVAALHREYSEERAAAFDRESDAILSQLEQLLNQIRRTNPAYADLQQPQPLTLTQIQQQVLDPETVLLQYAIGKERSYLWVVSGDDFNAYELPPKAALAAPIKAFRNAVIVPRSRRRSVKRKGDDLANLILPPQIGAQIAGKRLLVVGDGDLLSIPFAALPVPNQAEYTPLLERHEIFAQPSLSAISVLRQQTRNRNPAPKTLAILADPVYTNDDARFPENNPARSLPPDLDRTLRSLERASLNRLPSTRYEAEQILKLLPDSETNAVFDFNADRAWVTNPNLSQYRIVHFATHGFVNPENPALSGLVLSLVNSQGHTQPGFLRLSDIFNLNLPAELAVLSACQTGLGKNVSGEGLVGLTRGFMYAGTKRLIVSLWNVDDEATADLMVVMYGKLLQEKMTPAAALRAAQLEMWKSGKNPNLWAAFTVRGEWRE